MSNQKWIPYHVSPTAQNRLSLSCSELPALERFDTHTHTCFECLLLLDGDVEMHVGGEIHSLKVHDAIIIPPGLPHCLHLKSQAPYCRCVVHVTKEYLLALGLDELMKLMEAEGVNVYSLFGSPFLQSLPQSTKAALHSGSATLHRAIFNERLLSLYYALLAGTEKAGGSHSQGLVERAIQYINAHLEEKLSIESIAEQLYTSPSYLCRVFRNSMGLPLMHYVNRQRVQQACELILEGLPLKEVYLRCGYENYITFFRVFRAQTGVSPSVFGRNG